VLRVVWTGGREAEQDGVGFALTTLPEARSAAPAWWR
jgi:hypothetical protein